MTLDEAIKHATEVTERQEITSSFWHKGSRTYKNCLKCAEEHRQLATWLRELKQLREQMSSSEKPNKWINKPQESEDEKVIRIRKGTLKVRTGRYVIYDVEWLRTHFNTTEAKIYGQPNEDCISRKAVLEGLASIAKAKAKSDAQKSLMGRVMFFTEHLPSATPQPKEEPQPKTGHWEWVQYESKPDFGNWHCSECRHILCGAIKGNPVKLPNYCEDCGSYNGGGK